MFVLAAALLSAGVAQAGTNLFSTHFEPSEHYDAGFELIGQNGWVTDSQSFGGNGLLTNWLGSQAAYIGLFPLQPLDDYLAIWKPISFSPVQSRYPIVSFSVRMAVVDSTTTNRDDFYWSVYNQNGDNLFTIDFFNEDLGVYYSLDNTNRLFFSGLEFTNDTPYTLNVTMDFAQNKWSATLSNRGIVTNQPITVRGVPLDFGDVDALWIPFNSANPGDNYMVFDDYDVTAFISSNMQPLLSGFGRDAFGRFTLRVDGALGAKYAIDATTNLLQWTALATNSTSNGSFQFVDLSSPTVTNRFYRARRVP